MHGITQSKQLGIRKPVKTQYKMSGLTVFGKILPEQLHTGKSAWTCYGFRPTGMKLHIIMLCFLLSLFSLSYAGPLPQKKPGIRKVVIDAGHGGHDPGTVGKRSKEKDIALSVSLLLGKMIRDQYPDVDVVYTRTTDIFVELYRRAKIANESKADLFISVHCNGTRNTSAMGTETWVMGLHKSQENLEVAKKENASILMEDSYNQYDGFDPNSPEANIVFSLFQNVYLDQSLDIATRVQHQFGKKLGLIDRGVKQAGFWVLYKTTMPGILVETGFLSNPEDEAYLVSEKGQKEVATAIFNAFGEYKQSVEGVISGNGEKTGVKEPPLAVDKHQPDTGTGNRKVSEPAKPQENTFGSNADNEQLVYKVQIVSSEKEMLPGDPRFRGVRDVSHYRHQGAYRYTVGNFRRLQDAVVLQAEMQKKGFRDAFVVAFFKGVRISAEEAARIGGN